MSELRPSSKYGTTLWLVAALGAVFITIVVAYSWNPLNTWSSADTPPVLVILVENLGFGALSCGDEAEHQRGSGFQTFCDESVRFTHAYSPSVLTQATLASILTAKYPFSTNLRTNGAKAISAKEESVAEIAYRHGYKTSFFSGGPPVWRRAGLSRGFDLFDDNVPLSAMRLYRPASETVRLFLNWQENEAPRGRFFSFLYLPDLQFNLQFNDAPPTIDSSEVRESSFGDQFETIDESLGRLVTEMKRRKIWDSTAVFLVGLQGEAADAREGEVPSSNLFSESTRTTLMIKPPRKTHGGANVFNWKIDANVSLADVGMTLYDLLGEKISVSFDAVAPLVSLRTVLLGPQPDWPAERLIFSESAWPEWRGLGTIRAAARQGPYLYIYDEHEKLFNTLTDNAELVSLRNSDPAAAEMKMKFAGTLSSLGYHPWRALSRNAVEKAEIARDLWRHRTPSSETLNRLRDASGRDPADTQLRAWRANWAVRTEDWTDLKAVASQLPLQPSWAFLAEKNLGERAIVPEDVCLQFLKSAQAFTRPEMNKKCRVEGLADLVEWMNESNSEAVRVRAMEAFLHFMISREYFSRVAETNQVVGLKWDSVSLTDAPDTIDIILALPEMKKIKATVRNHLLVEGR